MVRRRTEKGRLEVEEAEIAAREEHTVICATHDPEVIRYADRVLELGVVHRERQPISR